MPITDADFNRIKTTLRKDSKEHGDLRKKLAQMRDKSQTQIALHYSEWDDQESRMKYYMTADFADAAESSRPSTKARRIVIPFSFLSQQVKQAMLMTIFYHEDPHVNIVGHGEEDYIPARLMEKVLDAQGAKMDRWIKDYQWFKDAKTYGLGVLYSHWDEQFGQVARRIKADDGSTISTVLRSGELTYQGNNCMNVDPYSFLPDPYRSLRDVQNGTFCGHRASENVEKLKDLGEKGVLFNTEHVKPVVSSYSGNPQDRADRHRTTHGAFTDSGNASGNLRTQIATGKGQDDSADETYAGFAHLFWRCRPKEFGLSESNTLELWHFILTDDGHVILAEPHETDKFPYFVIQPFGDLYTRSSPSESGHLAEIEDFATFLMSTRKESVYANLGGGIVYDESSIDEEDISRSDHGMRIKFRRRAGVTIDQVFRNIEFNDTTTGHVQDIEFLLRIFEYITGVSATMLGAVSSSSRNTATEIRGATNLATQRVRLEANLYSAQGYMPLNEHFIFQNMNRLELEQFLQITGADGQDAAMKGMVDGKVLRVPPDKLIGNFDLVPFDGAFPVDTLSQADSLQRFVELALQTPEGAYMNMEAVLDRFSTLIGLGRAGQFFYPKPPASTVRGAGVGAGGAPTEIVPGDDATVASEAQKGNLVEV